MSLVKLSSNKKTITKRIVRKKVKRVELEGPIEDRVVKWARSKGIEVTKMNLRGRRSWPDRCFWIEGGRPVLIEFKRPGEGPNPNQAAIIAKLKELGYIVEVFDDSDEAINFLVGSMPLCS